ncbi:MAG TPA: SH3 domain-containing protein [Rhizobiaceae bacterium]|nr:SH3 domain-containing protein [Rhizobiaceae bacterium]
MLVVKALRFLAPVMVVLGAAPSDVAIAQTTGSIQRGPSGLPLPRFVSLKGKSVNLRVGPGREYAVSWRYLKAGLPMEIIQEYDNWRRVRDAEGAEGWVFHSLLSGRRTAIAAPWETRKSGKLIAVLSKPQQGADKVAQVEPGVIGAISACDGQWCRMEFSSQNYTVRGWVDQAQLWGAYPQEKIED